MRSKQRKDEKLQGTKGALTNLREQLRRLHLRKSSSKDEKYKTTGQFSLISHIKDNNLSKQGIFGLNLSETNDKFSHNRGYSIKNSTRFK